MKRRDFVTNSFAGGTYISMGGLSLNSCKLQKTTRITILHTNDVHSHIDPFPEGHNSFPNRGGVARRAALVHKIREENPNTLLLDAGDIFQGTPYFNFYGGELEFKLMTMLRYDAATIGNHDFDKGIEGLLAQMPYANFKLLSANYDFTNTVMNGFVKAYETFLLDGIKIGVFGLGIKLHGLVPENLFKETVYQNPIEIAQDMSSVLKNEENCDLVICLSHLGYAYKDNQRPSDLQLAQKTDNIDLIIGGHTHTFLDKPVVRQNRLDKPVLVNQVGCYGINLGRIDFHFDAKKNFQSDGLSISV
ncbi:bifunctional UDP-sugar hydrolase/5'-nucleotidase [uncultured Eudoraea sp.]|uniref:bifunctional metallophosphatase/5'-nucleotidase n=1 Tax=uncultured Eudoraea sp. TaxID=1035614 RepID=UPI002612BE01|nr:metallophosphatase [uncultured Eudoraea sp.]